MNCRQALDRMLETEPGTLRNPATLDAALAAHLESCGRCRAVAAALTAELAELDDGMARLARGAGAAREPRSRHVRTWRRSRILMSLAAAAAVAGVVLVRPIGREDGPPDLPGPLAGERGGGSPGAYGPGAASGVAVTLPTDRGAAVMGTRNPKITVVWLYERSGS